MIILMYAYFIVLSIFTSSIFGQQHQPDPMDISVGNWQWSRDKFYSSWFSLKNKKNMFVPFSLSVYFLPFDSRREVYIIIFSSSILLEGYLDREGTPWKESRHQPDVGFLFEERALLKIQKR